MNNKIVSTKTASLIFLAIVLVAGTIALSSSTSSMIGANVQAQPYYDDDKMNNDYNNYKYSDYRDDKKKYDDRYVPTDYYGINKDTYVTYSYEPEYPSSYEPNHKPKHSSYDKDDPPPSEEPGATIGNGPLGITFDSF